MSNNPDLNEQLIIRLLQLISNAYFGGISSPVWNAMNIQMN